MKILLPVTWEVCGMVEVEADSINEAIMYSMKRGMRSLSLPTTNMSMGRLTSACVNRSASRSIIPTRR